MLLELTHAEDCPSFADLVSTDPDGLAEGGEVPRIEAAVAEFAAWTGREGVCVRVTHHELCHDLDFAHWSANDSPLRASSVG